MLSTDNKESFLKIVRSGIGHDDGVLPKRIEWDVIKTLAAQQGLSAIVMDGIEKLPEEKRPPKFVLLQWIGEVFQNYEQRFELYRKAIVELAGWYQSHDFKMMILKGYACSLDWPKPEHRPCGDIDIWLFGKQKEADAILSKEKGVIIDTSEHHHSVFVWRNFLVENHFDFIEVHHHQTSLALEKILKELGQDDNHFVETEKGKINLPSPNLHALFLLRHAMEHFASTDINLRQLLDWAFFVKKHYEEVDWHWLEGVLDEFGMLRMYVIFNAICVEDLGFDVNLFKRGHFEREIKERVLNEILSPEFNEEQPQGIMRRVYFKYRRWKANGWKQKFCYKGSRWSAFWFAAWNHILKPSSI